MKSTRNLLLYLFLLLFTVGCYSDLDDEILPSSELEIKNFIWRVMNTTYLYKADVPNLADDRFATQEELDEFLQTFSSPESLFYDGLLADHDQFSFLVPDYRELERAFDGLNVSNGMQYGVIRYSATSEEVLGYVRYVLPNTSAEEQGIERGLLFNTVDGEQLTRSNYFRLLQPESYTIGLAELIDGEVVSTGETITLQKEEYTSNPVYIAEVLETSAGKVGYLMYNGFTSNFDSVLNEAFAMFKAEGITDLIVDLRYNSGGSVETASDLASMITGQFEGEIFSKEQWNEDFQAYFEETDPDLLINRFNNRIENGETINSLGLGKVYFITTLRTASASELLINGLKPYIDVVQVGENTTGKFQASRTFYDSPNFLRSGANLGHTYAVQPLIFKTLNANNVSDYVNGLPPDVEISESFRNLGILGNPQEPLLSAVLDLIEGRSPVMDSSNKRPLDVLGESGMYDQLYQKMYSEDSLPALEL